MIAEALPQNSKLQTATTNGNHKAATTTTTATIKTMPNEDHVSVISDGSGSLKACNPSSSISRSSM